MKIDENRWKPPTLMVLQSITRLKLLKLPQLGGKPFPDKAKYYTGVNKQKAVENP